MSCAGGPDLIQDGLVLCLDAANTKSYSGSGTIWRDLSGNNNNGTLTNGPTFSSENSGSIVFDGTNDYIQCGNLSSMGITNDLTIEIWLQLINMSLNNYITVFDTPQRSLSLWIGSQFYAIGKSSGSYSGNFNWQSNKWMYICMKRTGTNTSIIKNNFEVSASFTALGIDFNNNLEFGSNPSGGGTIFKGNMASIKLYKKALTDTQILQNYNALKGRFQLT